MQFFKCKFIIAYNSILRILKESELKLRKEHLSQYLDGLEKYEHNEIKDDTSLEPWRKNFLFRFYEQLKSKKLKKKNISKNVNSETDKYNLLFEEHKLPVNTLTEYTKYDSSKKLRTISVSNLIAISNALNVSIDYLLGIEKCESHENTDINRVIGLTDNAINNLKNNDFIQLQLNDYLINEKFIKLIKAIEDEKYVRLIYCGVSKEFSELLFDILKKSYKIFMNEVFTLDRNVNKYKKYLSLGILNSELLNENDSKTLDIFLKKHLSPNLHSQFYGYVEDKQIKNVEIFTAFVSFVAEFVYITFEQDYYKELSSNKISETFIEIVNDFFNNSIQK